ncbi:MAG: phosphatidylinositol-specific phospholipase C/glycerophosphodiester phosphodiesterase family protein [Planctomycetota bacterium]
MALVKWLLMTGFLTGCGSVSEASNALAAPVRVGPDPALRLHGHNDYLQPVPLHAALELGLGSVEADVFLVDGELRVGHELWQLRPGRTLAAMYLEPLRVEAQHRGGRIRGDGKPFVLLVDIKTDGAAVYRHLREELGRYRDLLTRFVDGRIEPSAVTVILSGDRPRAMVAADRERWCALDGRLADLAVEPPPPPDLAPWISDSWQRISDWDGKDELTTDERQRVRDLVARAHAGGRELRFWGAPDRAEAWSAFFELGLDRIGTDRPKVAVDWLRNEGTSPAAR